MTRKKTTAGPVRLQKFLSDAGVASRRRAEELIREGRVLVNDAIVCHLPAFVDPLNDRVIVDGTPVRVRPAAYFLVHKPKGVVCTNRDPAGRLRAIDLLPPTKTQLSVVGRLDVDSTGLLLMTNDGELAELIAHPRLGVPKVYRVEVRGEVSRDIVAALKKGVRLAEGRAAASEAEILHRGRRSSVLRITLREGRNRQVRRMLAHLDHAVKTLKRVQIGPLRLRDLPVGACRELTGRELAELRKALKSAEKKRQRAQTAGPPARKSAAGARKPKQAGSPRSTRPTAGPRRPPPTQQHERPRSRRRRLIT